MLELISFVTGTMLLMPLERYIASGEASPRSSFQSFEATFSLCLARPICSWLTAWCSCAKAAHDRRSDHMPRVASRNGTRRGERVWILWQVEQSERKA